ncbi:MAG: TorF family putative porin [bacterium]
MKMKTIVLACGAVLMGASAVAQAEVSANIGASSDYVWRGVSQTDGGAAVSGGLDFAADSGFYLGTWASNVDFGAGGEVEWDLYGGFGGEAGEMGYDVGVVYYAYPSSDDADFAEIYGSLSWGMLSGGINYTFYGQNDDGLFDNGDLYYFGALSFDLPQDFGLGLTIGHYDFENGGSDADYNHYQADLSKSFGDFGDFTFSLSQSEEEADGDDDLKVFVSWSKGF